jgi:hypothetical protein
MGARMTIRQVERAIATGEQVDVLIRRADGPASPEGGVRLTDLDGEVVTFVRRDGEVERAHLDDVMDAAVVRRRLSGTGRLSKLLDVVSWIR